MKKMYLSAIAASLVLLAACSNNPGQARADYELAIKYMQGTGGVAQDQQKGVEMLIRASAEGSADADLALGYLYLKGKGVEQDPAKAVTLFERAGETGNIDAQYNAGLAYAHGQGIPEDFAKAAHWFELAALQGDAGAQFNMGVMTINAEGVPRDALSAYAWFALADEQGYEGAADAMVKAKTNLTSDQIKEIDRAIARLKSRVTKPVMGTADSAPL